MKEKYFNMKTTLGFLGFIAIVYILFPVQFEVNDDSFLMEYISGSKTGKPQIVPFIMTIYYSAIVAGLDSITSAVPWYTIILLLIIFIDSFIIYKCFISLLSNKILAISCFFLMYIGAILYCSINITYTTVSGLSTAACGSLLIYVLRNRIAKVKISSPPYVIILLLSFLASNVRITGGLVTVVIICFIIFGNFFVVRKIYKEDIIIAIVALAIIFGTRLSNEIYVDKTDWKEYVILHDERSIYKDFDHLEYANNEEIYNGIGWDENVYTLVNKWCFLDQSIDIQDFAILNQQYTSGDKNYVNMFTNAINRMFQENIVKTTIIMWFLLLFFIGLIILHKGRKDLLLEYIFDVGFLCLYIAFIILLYIKGRTPLRTIHLSLLSTFIPGLLSMLVLLEKLLKDYEKHQKVIFIGICVALIVPISLIGANLVKNREQYDYEYCNKVYDIAIKNHSNIYVMDRSIITPLSPYKTYKRDETPYNVFFWGGWLYGSPIMKTQFYTNGLEELSFEVMLNENAYFVGNEEGFQLLLTYYENHYIDIEAEINEKLEDSEFFIYSFRTK